MTRTVFGILQRLLRRKESDTVSVLPSDHSFLILDSARSCRHGSVVMPALQLADRVVTVHTHAISSHRHIVKDVHGRRRACLPQQWSLLLSPVGIGPYPIVPHMRSEGLISLSGMKASVF